MLLPNTSSSNKHYKICPGTSVTTERQNTSAFQLTFLEYRQEVPYLND